MNRKGTFFILAAAVLWGMAGLFVRQLSGLGVLPAGIVFYSAFFTVIIIGIIMAGKDKNAFKIKINDLWLFAGNGVLSIVMFNFCYYKTMSISSLSVAAVLLYTAPVFVMIMSVLLFKEKMTVKKALAVVLAFIGCICVSGVIGSGERLSGGALFYGLLTGFGYALYTVFSNVLLRRGYSTLPIIFYTFVFALIGSLPLVLSGANTLLSSDFSVYIWALLMGAFNTVLPYVFYTVGLKNIEPSKAPVIATAEPVAATVLGLFYGEKLTFYGVIGIILVLSSVITVNTKSGEKQ